MPSVIVTWRGTCPVRSTQEELLGFLREVAERNARWLDESPPKPPDFPRVIVPLPLGTYCGPDREESGRSSRETPIRIFNQEITGRILLDPDLVVDRSVLPEETESSEETNIETPGGNKGLRCNVDEKGSPYLRPARLHVHGIDFELFDPRGLYHENRISFVFLGCPELTAANGCIAQVDDRHECRLYKLEALRSAEWFIHEPRLHLRYCMEEWTDLLLGWVKYFFVQDLEYWRYKGLPGYGALREVLESRCQGHGLNAAKRSTFEDILDEFEREAWRWQGMGELGVARDDQPTLCQEVNLANQAHLARQAELRQLAEHDRGMISLCDRDVMWWIPVSVRNVLTGAGVQTLGDIASMTAQEARSLSGSGQQTCAEIRLLLQQFGLDFRPPSPASASDPER